MVSKVRSEGRDNKTPTFSIKSTLQRYAICSLARMIALAVSSFLEKMNLGSSHERKNGKRPLKMIIAKEGNEFCTIAASLGF